MGKLRARTKDEFNARKEQILDAAERQILRDDFTGLNLATIASDVSLSRPSLYNYFPTKEDVLLELLVREYIRVDSALQGSLSMNMTRLEFCEALADLFIPRKALLKLLALQLPVLNHDFEEDNFQRFVRGSAHYAQTMREVIKHQFPTATPDERNMFFIQLSMFNNALYELTELSQENLDSMVEIGAFDRIPSPRTIYIETLMKLSEGFER